MNFCTLDGHRLEPVVVDSAEYEPQHPHLSESERHSGGTYQVQNVDEATINKKQIVEPKYSNDNTKRVFISTFIVALSYIYASISGNSEGRGSYDNLDTDGMIVLYLYIIVTGILSLYILVKKSPQISRINTPILRIGLLVASFICSSSLGIWNQSLTYAFEVLSICLSVLFACLYIKKQ